MINTKQLENKVEYDSFWKTASIWKGSVSPRVMKRVLYFTLYACIVTALATIYPQFQLSITPFEYSGVILGMLLVTRVNAGYDRWWEARKVWGSIVNQSRNLATQVICYSSSSKPVRAELLGWIKLWPYSMKESLRSTKEYSIYANSNIQAALVEEVKQAGHMPNYIGMQIAHLLTKVEINGFAFHRADKERSIMIDNIGKCERILKTPIPLALAIKARRFILLFLAFLPFGLAHDIGTLSPVVGGLVAYALFSLDQIGVELQNPFSKESVSHLPLQSICETIESNINSLEKEFRFIASEETQLDIKISQLKTLPPNGTVKNTTLF